MINLTPTQLRHAANIQEQIQELQSELNEILGASGFAETPSTEEPKRKMSATGRRAIGAAAKARWAKYNAAKGKPAKKGKRKLSAQGLANIRAGVAKRWAAKGKAGKPARRRGMSPAAKRKMAVLMKARWAKAKKAGKATL